METPAHGMQVSLTALVRSGWAEEGNRTVRRRLFWSKALSYCTGSFCLVCSAVVARKGHSSCLDWIQVCTAIHHPSTYTMHESSVNEWASTRW